MLVTFFGQIFLHEHFRHLLLCLAKSDATNQETIKSNKMNKHRRWELTYNPKVTIQVRWKKN